MEENINIKYMNILLSRIVVHRVVVDLEFNRHTINTEVIKAIHLKFNSVVIYFSNDKSEATIKCLMIHNTRASKLYIDNMISPPDLNASAFES